MYLVADTLPWFMADPIHAARIGVAFAAEFALVASLADALSRIAERSTQK